MGHPGPAREAAASRSHHLALNGPPFLWLAVLLLLGGYLALCLGSARGLAVTPDEPKHYEYGLQILNLNSDRLPSELTQYDDSKMPITALNAVPGLVAPRLPDGSNIGAYAATLQAGRAITILVSVLIGLFIFL